jgi:hypothetical protein
MQLPTQSDMQASLQNHPFETLQRIDFAGLAPAWCDLGCRVCFGIIRPHTPIVDTGHAPYHMLCYAMVFNYAKEAASELV